MKKGNGLRVVVGVFVAFVLAGALVATAGAEGRRDHHPKPSGDHGKTTEIASTSTGSSTTTSTSSGDRTVYVSASRNCGSGRTFSEIGDAVAAVDAGGTVHVCPGKYEEDVVVTKPVTIVGDDATVQPDPSDSSPLSSVLGGNNGFTVLAANVTISGFTVQGATSDGIFVLGDHALIENVTATGNTVNGINLDGSSWSVVRHDAVTQNGGGIELANDPEAAGISMPGSTGTASYDLVADNQVYGNPQACAIYLVDHAGGGLPGIHHNTIRGNTVYDNATQGFGAGVLLASPAPGGSIYDNTISGNTIYGNGLPGVAIHSHVAGQNFEGNVISNNWIGTNNVLGLEFHDEDTTGVYVGSVDPLTVTITGNTIAHDRWGIFLAGPAVSVTGTSSNTFDDVRDVFGTYPFFE